MLFKIFIIYLLLKSGVSNKNVLNITGIFEAAHLEEMVRKAIMEFNSQKDTNFKLNLLRSSVTPDDPFFALTETCRHLESGVVGVFGPISFSNVDIVRSICDAKHIPHILTHWADPKLKSQINFFPNPKHLSRVYMDIITNFGWDEVTLLYTSSNSLEKLSDFIEKGTRNGLTIYVERLNLAGGDYRSILRRLRDSDQYNFMLAEMEDLGSILFQMQQIGMLISKYNYIIADVNVDYKMIKPFTLGKAQIIVIQHMHPSEPALASEGALIMDAVHMFSNTLKMLNITQGSGNLSCSNSNTWREGSTIVNLLKKSTYNGLTGQIQFDVDGYRSVLKLVIYQIQEGIIKSEGTWHSTTGLYITKNEVKVNTEESDRLVNRDLIVVITLAEPYAMEIQSPRTLVGNDRFEGFAIDLIQELALMSDFTYTLNVRSDNNIGGFDPKAGKWTGIIGDIVAGRADLGIADITITSEREEAVDFTTPFMMSGISILYQAPTYKPRSFTDPFTTRVWILILVAFISTTVLILILGRITPSEWKIPNPHTSNPQYVTNDLGLSNSLWFVTGSITKQGSDIKLRSVATRTIGAVWWFFTFFIVSIYLANLVVVLMSRKLDIHFSNFEELVQNAEEKGITYGSKRNGATAHFIKNQAMHQPDSVFATAWEFMQSHEEDMAERNIDGVEKAQRERYAFLMESSSLEYAVQRRCNLQQVGDLLSNSGYGIAMQKNSSFRVTLSKAILKLQISGKMDELKRKWWNERRGGGFCSVEDKEPESLELHDFSEVFWITTVGILLAFLLALVEAFVYALKKSRRNKMSLKKTLKEEFLFNLVSCKMVKPVASQQTSKRGKPEERELESLQD